MAIKFHTLAALIVLGAAAAWVATGEFSSVGSEMGSAAHGAEAAVPPEPVAKPVEATQAVAFVVAQPAGYERTIHISGQTEADKQVMLVARTAGVIAKLPVEQGDSVEKDALVMALDAPEKLAAVDSAKAQFDAAAHQAEANEKLNARGALPDIQLQNSIAAREAARSALEMARAEVGRMEVRTPFGGIVDRVFVEVGAWVQPGMEVASILALDPIIVAGEINERDLPAVSKGSRAIVTFGDGTTAEGEVRYVRRAASGQTRTFPIEVAIANPEGKFAAGMSAEIRLAAKTAPAVVLPRSVVTLTAEGDLGVRTLNEDNTVGFLPVTIVDDTPRGLVVAGIPEGTRIIVSGQAMVTDGQKVSAVPATTMAGVQQAAD